MKPSEQTERFCSVLFADPTGALDGYYGVVWSSHNRVTRWPQAEPAATAAAIREADSARGALATYLGMAPCPTPGRQDKRAGNDQVGALVAVWVDIDFAGPAHDKPGLPRTEADARRILGSVGLAPTMVWHTGHGMQAVWCLAEPWVFEPGSAEAGQAASLVRDWVLTLAVHAHRLGRWPLDRVHDLARVLRAPGTINRKITGDHRPVRLLEINDAARYGVDDLLERLIERTYLDQFTGMTSRAAPGEGAGAVDLPAVWALVNSRDYRERDYEPEWVTGLIESGVLSEGDTLIRVFREGHSSGDPSSRDASLARCLANVRHDGDRVFDERDAVEIIMCSRLRDGVKLEKVDPARRQDYVVRTVDKVFGEADADYVRRETERTEMAAAAVAALAAQDAAAARCPLPEGVTRQEPGTPPGQSPHILRGMGAEIMRENAAHSDAVVPDPEDDASPVPGDLPAGDRDGGEHKEGAQVHGPAQPQVSSGERGVHDTAYSDLEQVVLRPMVSPWGTRTESQHRELTALSASLLGPYAEFAQIWRCQYRGRGAKQERRCLVRIDGAHRWPGVPPESYVAGTLLASGWYPAGAFNTVGGWIRALRQDCMLITQPVSAEEFTGRFGDTLVRIWEPDTSGGSLASVTREAIVSYLLDYPPTPEWVEATAQGVPFIVQDAPRWSVSTRFTVLLRWNALARHVRTHFAVNVTPAIAAEMAELAGAPATPTITQDGQWRMVRRDYLGDAVWSVVLHGGQVAELRREDRHGLHVVGALPEEQVDGLGGVHRGAPGGAQ